MSSVNEWIVREYLESLGFLVLQPRKYQVIARAKRPEEEMDLLAYNPHPEPAPAAASSLLWSADNLKSVRAALVGVRGWHTDRITPANLELSPELVSIAAPEVVRAAEERLGVERVMRVLCVPALAASRELRDETLEALRAAGIDGVLTFRTLLLELAAFVDVNRHYEQSDLLQIVRLLKIYDVLKGPQMELFAPRARRGRAAAAAEEAGVGPDGAPPSAAPGEEPR